MSTTNRFQDFSLNELKALDAMIDPAIKTKALLKAGAPSELLDDLRSAIQLKEELSDMDFSDFELDGGCESGACHL
jgi:hypothetical protein